MIVSLVAVIGPLFAVCRATCHLPALFFPSSAGEQRPENTA